ncbi:hypothetical protein ZOSMA_30G00070 [Zostera marina]|uniref:RRM domain-containing protein n=1 Tax=Zostera marina TaxID=29655 RepID=A0A0K9P9T9_ZOSMR|nr:hypothetical protein ZOSMA_30G00070 [Zostera marina]
MTIDDERSIYVGGFAYDFTEEDLRDIFEIYGSVVAVKIIDDRAIGGKCYGFVTFTNPRSVVNAITEMNGRTIGGRVIKVNEVRTRAGKQYFNRENFRRSPERDIVWDREHSRDREHYWDRNNDLSQDCDREWEYENYDRDRIREHSFDRYRDGYHEDIDRDSVRDYARNLERDDDIEWDPEKPHRRNFRGGKYNDRNRASTRHRSGQFNLDDYHSRAKSSNSSEKVENEVKGELQVQLERRGEIQKEVDELQEKLNDKDEHILELQKKYQKLEEALTVARNISSRQKNQLMKFRNSFLQVQDCTERLKHSELQLQSLFIETRIDDDDDGDDMESLP